jgi:hypothetical protein
VAPPPDAGRARGGTSSRTHLITRGRQLGPDPLSQSSPSTQPAASSAVRADA